jgi:hypothetical protein
MMPNDTDIELRETLGLAVDAHATVATEEPLAAIEQRVTRRRHRRHVVIGGSIAAAIVVVVAAVSAVALNDDTDHPRVVVSPSTNVPEPLLSKPIEVMPNPPLAVRGDVVAVWTGDELVVWGGDVEAFNMGLPGEDRAYNDGAAFSLVTRMWRAMAPSPLPANAESAAAAATNDGVVIARGTKVAKWNAETNTWTRLIDAPRAVNDLVVTEDLVLSYSANAVLDLTTGAWKELPPPPEQLERSATAWTGTELVVIGGPGTPFTSAKAIALDPKARTWRRLANPPSDTHAEALSADWDGTRVVAVNYDMKAIAYYPENDSWAKLPSVPARFYEWYPTLRSAGDSVVAFMSQAMVVMDREDRWIPLPNTDLAFGRVAKADELLFVVGMNRDDELVLTAIDPARAAAEAGKIQVGIATMSLPAGFAVSGSEYVDRDFNEAVRVNIANGARECALTSTYGAGVAEDLTNEVIDGYNWYRNETRTAWETDFGKLGESEGLTDVVGVRCDRAADAKAVRDTIRRPNYS